TQTNEFSWSPDSGRIVYSSKKSGAQNLWLVSVDGANETQLTNNNDANVLFFSPVWSADGKSIAYTSKSNRAVDGKFSYGVWVFDVETKTARTIFQTENFLRLLGWAEDGKGLIIAAVNGKTPGPSLTDVVLA